MSPFRKWLVWSSSAVTAATGVVYWWMDRFLEPVGEWAVINHPLQPWVLKAHIVAAPVLVFAIGLIAADHVWKHFVRKVRKARRSGLLTGAVLVPMILSGYLIQVVTAVTPLEAIAWVHIGTGLVYAIGTAAHAVGVRTRSASRAPGSYDRAAPAPEAEAGAVSSAAGESPVAAGASRTAASPTRTSPSSSTSP